MGKASLGTEARSLSNSDRVTATEFASVVGLSARRVRELCQSGVLLKGDDRRLSLRESMPRYFESLRDAARHRGLRTVAGAVISDPMMAQTRLNRERALLLRERNRLRAAALVQTESVSRVVDAIVTTATTAIGRLQVEIDTVLASGGHLPSERRAATAHLDRAAIELRKNGRAAVDRMVGGALEKEDHHED